jgi:GNAT superfamily N-acetyltransferase
MSDAAPLDPFDPTAPAGLVIRPAREGDLRCAVELMELGRVSGAPPREIPENLAPYRRALREIESGEGAVLVAELGGEVVGVCQLLVFRHLQTQGGLCAEIESVHVHPDHRGHGIGTSLLREAVARARACGCYRVQLTSNAARPDAHRFYGRLGFSPSHVGFKLPLT